MLAPDTQRFLPGRNGFALCGTCLPLRDGQRRICAECFTAGLKPVTDPRCQTCSHPLTALGSPCANALCATDAKRYFTEAHAIALYSGSLGPAIKNFKRDGQQKWAEIFARMLLKWLDDHSNLIEDVDLIIGNPTYAGRQPNQHIELLMQALAAADTTRRWPLPVGSSPLSKTRETPRSACSGNRDTKATAAIEHAAALKATGALRGLVIVVIDDVLTTGAQINAVAQYLIEECGAREVRALVLARATWNFRINHLMTTADILRSLAGSIQQGTDPTIILRSLASTGLPEALAALLDATSQNIDKETGDKGRAERPRAHHSVTAAAIRGSFQHP